MEDWALIRRLVADGVPQRQVARDLGIGRATVARAVAYARLPLQIPMIGSAVRIARGEG